MTPIPDLEKLKRLFETDDVGASREGEFIHVNKDNLSLYPFHFEAMEKLGYKLFFYSASLNGHDGAVFVRAETKKEEQK